MYAMIQPMLNSMDPFLSTHCSPVSNAAAAASSSSLSPRPWSTTRSGSSSSSSESDISLKGATTTGAAAAAEVAGVKARELLREEPLPGSASKPALYVGDCSLTGLWSDVVASGDGGGSGGGGEALGIPS